MPSFQCLIISIIEKTPVLASRQEPRSSVSRITRVDQILLVEFDLYDFMLLLQAVKLSCASTDSHHYISIVVAELCTVNKAISGLNNDYRTS